MRHHRTIFISDTHSGTRGCKAEKLCRFENAVIAEARARSVDGGDRVESCTALTEDARGHLEILHWAPSAAEPAPAFVPQTAEDTAGALIA
jgi:hypothetical protein